MWRWLQAWYTRTRKIDECLDAIVREVGSSPSVVPPTIYQVGQHLSWKLAADHGIILPLGEACHLAERRLRSKR